MSLCVAAGVYLLLTISGCDKHNASKFYTYTLYKPVLALKSTVLANLNGDAGKKIDAAGKIYRKDPWLFVNDIDKGIHIIDNSDPRHPAQVAFLSIPGNQDIAVRGNILYADMYTDLLAIDISDPHHVKLIGDLPHTFPYRYYVNGTVMDSLHVATDWIKKDTTVIVSTQPINPGGVCVNCLYSAESLAPSAGKSSGTGGSMARMTLIDDHLYAIAEPHSLSSISLNNSGVPALASNQYIGFDLETIFPFQDKLFLGSKEGVYMFGISDHPDKPVSLGQFLHGRSCDPVVTDGNYAYITLHEGTMCGGASNELDVVNIQDPAHPGVAKIYPMTKPQGLSKDGNLLFVCDSTSGVKLFDASDPQALRSIAKIGKGSPYDVIAGGNRLLVVDATGLYQYDYSNTRQIDLLSFFPVK